MRTGSNVVTAASFWVLSFIICLPATRTPQNFQQSTQLVCHWSGSEYSMLQYSTWNSSVRHLSHTNTHVTRSTTYMSQRGSQLGSLFGNAHKYLWQSHLRLLWLVRLVMCVLDQLRKEVVTQKSKWSPLKDPSWAYHVLCGGSTSAVPLRWAPTVVMWTRSPHRPASDPAQQIIVCNKFQMSPRVCPLEGKGPYFWA